MLFISYYGMLLYFLVLLVGCSDLNAKSPPQKLEMPEVHFFVKGTREEELKSIPLNLSVDTAGTIRDMNSNRIAGDKLVQEIRMMHRANPSQIAIKLKPLEGLEDQVTAQQFASVVTRLVKAAIKDSASEVLRIEIVVPDQK